MSITLGNVGFSALCLLLGTFIWHKSKGRRYALPFPPGPKPRFLTGNLHQISPTKSWLTYGDWAREFKSDVVSGTVFGTRFLVVNSRKTAIELFDRRSNNYSNRPESIIVKLMGWDFNAGLLPYGNEWRDHRKVHHQLFRKDGIEFFEPILQTKVHQLLHSLLVVPEGFLHHVQMYFSSAVMLSMYGQELKSVTDPFVKMAAEAADLISDALLPGSTYVDALPFLRFLPAWFPGVQFQGKASRSRELTHKLVQETFDLVKENLHNNDTISSVASRGLEKILAKGGSEYEEHILKCVAATAYTAGADTTITALKSTFVALCQHPHVVKKAQQEILSHTGERHLPTFKDRPSLPYVEAVYREIMRWRPVNALGLAHAVADDDVWNGYVVPKGAIIYANIWAMSRDPEIYDNAEEFRPERFFDANGKLNDDDAPLHFGFGRRICVGRHLASAGIWLAIANMLAIFDFGLPKDEQGSDIPLEVEYTDGTISHPKPFKCTVTPRSAAAQKLVMEAIQADLLEI